MQPSRTVMTRVNFQTTFRRVAGWFIAGVVGLSGFPSERGNRGLCQRCSPLLAQSCGKCHGAGMAMAQLRLDSEASILQGGKSGPTIVPGKSGDSLLIKRILGLTDGPRMPMGGDPLSADKVQILREGGSTRARFGSGGEGSNAPGNAGFKQAPAASDPMFAQKVRPFWLPAAINAMDPDVQQNGLRLDSFAAISRAAIRVKVMCQDKVAESRLVRRLLARSGRRCPTAVRHCAPDQISVIRQWIDRRARSRFQLAGRGRETAEALGLRHARNAACAGSERPTGAGLRSTISFWLARKRRPKALA